MNAEQRKHLEAVRISPVASIEVRGSEVDGIVCVAARYAKFVTASFFNSDHPSFFGGQYATVEEAKAAALKGRQAKGEWIAE
jgi:hypothetical protein